MIRQALTLESSRHIGVLFAAGAIGHSGDQELLERFLAGHDRTDAGAAFEALIRRHGPMVERVCRSVLGHTADVDDAFQATFLVLARRAASIRDRDALASWLFGVALRVSRHLKVDEARRRAVENGLAETRRETVMAAMGGQTDCLHEVFEEVDRLPERYRTPIVLCYVEGKTHEQASRVLACPMRTLQTRLLRGKERLRARLVRRGLAPAAAVAGLEAVSARFAEAASGVMLEKLVEGTILAVMDGAKAGGAGLVSSAVAEAARDASRALVRSGLRRVIGVAGIAAAGLAMLAIGLAAAGEKPGEPVRAVTGRVTDEAGKPIAGAGVWMPWTMAGSPEETSHARTDVSGRFTLPVTETWASLPLHRRSAVIWAHAPGHAIATENAYQILNGKPGTVEMTLGPKTDTSFLVLGPNGRPLAGAVVEPFHVLCASNAYDIPPAGLVGELRGVTDSAGLASLPGVPKQGFYTVQVTSKALGSQQFQLIDKSSQPARRTLVLRGVGRLEGQLVAERPELAKGVKVYLYTQGPGEQNGSSQLSAIGIGVVTTGDDGRFVVPAIASGPLTIVCQVAPNSPVRAKPPESIVIDPGRTKRLGIPLVAAVKVRGTIRVKGTGKPMAGVSISVSNIQGQGDNTVVSDQAGRFENHVFPGDVRAQIIAMTGEYAQSDESWDQPVKVPADVATFDLQTVEVVPTRAVRGKLLRDKGRPLVRGMILARQAGRLRGYGQADANGEFSLSGILEGPIEGFQARFGDEEEGWHDLAIVSRDPLVLREASEAAASASAGVTIHGTVNDHLGRPASDAMVELIIETPTVALTRESLSTDANGRYRTVRPTKPGTTIRAIASGEAYTVVGSAPLSSDGKSDLSFGAIRVERLRSISGSVMDTSGKPVPGARVLNWGNPGPLKMAVTGEDGRFELGGLTRSASRLLVEANGFRAHGHDIGPDDSTVTMRLRREDQPPEGTIRPRGTGLSREETVALARRVIEPLREEILEGQDEDLRRRGLPILAKIDPDDAIRRCLANESPWNCDDIRISAVYRLMRTVPPDAVAILPAITSRESRFYTRLYLIDALGPDRAAMRKSLFAEAIQDARREEAPGSRATRLMGVARYLLGCGDIDQARTLSDEAMALIVPGGDSDPALVLTRSVLPTLARIDLKAALARIPTTGDDRYLNILRGEIALAIAATRPDEAERLLGSMTWNKSSDDILRVSVRMARVDLPRARRITDTVKEDVLRGLALGKMADALNSSDPAVARELLEEAFRTFPQVMERGLVGTSIDGPNAAANLAGALLPVVERVQPGRIGEYVERVRALRWYPRTLADRTSRSPDTSDLEAMRSAAVLAAQLVPYDRELAQSIARPILAHLREPRTELERKYMDFYSILPVLALADPRGTVDLVEAMPDDGVSSLAQTRAVARRVVADALATPESGRAAIIRRGSFELGIAERAE